MQGTSHLSRDEGAPSGHKGGEHGGALVEIALAVTRLLLLTIGVFDFGRAVWIRNWMANAASEATRYAALHSAESPEPATVASIKRRMQDWLPPTDVDRLTVRATWTPANTPGSVVQVSASYRYEPLLKLLPVNSNVPTSSSRRLISY